MRSYIADRLRITVILSLFAVPLVGMYIGENYEDWAFADLGRAAVPEHVRFREIRSESFVDQIQPIQDGHARHLAARPAQ
jgi:hypothetical protein